MGVQVTTAALARLAFQFIRLIIYQKMKIKKAQATYTQAFTCYLQLAEMSSVTVCDILRISILCSMAVPNDYFPYQLMGEFCF